MHLAKIALAVAPGAHAGVVLEGTRWHGGKDLLVHSKITLIAPLPYSFDLNPVENVCKVCVPSSAPTPPSTATLKSSTNPLQLGTSSRTTRQR